MNPNFPNNLAINPSSPSLILHHLVPKCHDTDLGNIISENASVVSSQKADIETYGIAGRIWEASYAMTIFIDPPSNWEFDPQCSIFDSNRAVIELGAGTGFLGFKLARVLSARQDYLLNSKRTVLITDMEAVCPLLERNRQQEFGCAANSNSPTVDLVVRPLDWGNLGHGNTIAEELISALPRGDALLSHIFCSDLVYFPELFPPLLRTLLQLSSPPFSSAAQPVEIIISYMIRSLTKEITFWSVFGTWFDFSPALVRHKSPPTCWERFGNHEEGTMFIFVATRKPESLNWVVPGDLELMRGNDETFEALLFMNILGEE